MKRETIIASGATSEPSEHTQATARPWEFINEPSDYGAAEVTHGYIQQANGAEYVLAVMVDDSFGLDAAANAALIVKAVNRDHHFDALVKLVQEILTDELCNNGAPPGVGWFDRAEKLIAALAGAK